MKSPLKHKLIARSGETWTGTIEWTGIPDPHRKPYRKYEQDFLLILFQVDGVKVWLDNYCTRLKCGKGNNWYYELDEKGEKKIKKALERANTNSTAKI